MNNTRPYWKVLVSLIFSILATAAVLLIGLGVLRFLMPFVIGWIISCIANPLVCLLEKHLKIVKKWGSVIIIILVVGGVAGLMYLVLSQTVRELSGFVTYIPELFRSVGQGMADIKENLAGLLEMLPDAIRNASANVEESIAEAAASWISGLSEPTVSIVGDVAKSIPGFLIGSIVALISAYFFVAEREEFLKWVKKVVPKAVYDRMIMVITNFKVSVGGYFLAQFKIMGVVFVILFVGFTLLKVKYTFVLSLVISFLDFLPFFGTGTAFWPWCLYTLLTGDIKRFVFLFILYAISQIVRQSIQPKLVGDTVGLNPLPTLLFIYIGYRLGGFIWMIIAVPVGIIIINMYKAGAFDYILDDVKILIKGIMSLRE